ncbi:hypothetical protein [Bernardetia sp.]|uniref:hypothetical protein n=1 Tax=Bernardetia sp. TaxID=1937974 RepID=UPI0025BAEB04|nr:hypothetical protein [Bernardetia sp.]
MKKTVRKIILRSLLCLFLTIVGYFSYEFYFKYPLQEYFKSQVVKRMKQNFKNHETDFEELVGISKDLKNLKNFELYENDIVALDIEHNSKNVVRTEYIWLIERNDSVFYDIDMYGGEVFIEEIKFVGDSILILTYRTNEIKKLEFINWNLSYKGNLNNSLFKEILNHQKIDFKKFVHFKEKVEEVNCHTFWRRGEMVSLAYAGRTPADYFAYDIYEKTHEKKYILGQNYLCRYQEPFICLVDITNWYGEGKVD